MNIASKACHSTATMVGLSLFSGAALSWLLGQTPVSKVQVSEPTHLVGETIIIQDKSGSQVVIGALGDSFGISLRHEQRERAALKIDSGGAAELVLSDKMGRRRLSATTEDNGSSAVMLFAPNDVGVVNIKTAKPAEGSAFGLVMLSNDKGIVIDCRPDVLNGSAPTPK